MKGLWPLLLPLLVVDSLLVWWALVNPWQFLVCVLALIGVSLILCFKPRKP